LCVCLCLCVFVCVLSSRCLVCRPSHLCVRAVSAPLRRVKIKIRLLGFTTLHDRQRRQAEETGYTTSQNAVSGSLILSIYLFLSGGVVGWGGNQGVTRAAGALACGVPRQHDELFRSQHVAAHSSLGVGPVPGALLERHVRCRRRRKPQHRVEQRRRGSPVAAPG
jgi:hypothetical protein